MDKIISFYNNLPDEVKAAIWSAICTLITLFVGLLVATFKAFTARAKLREAEANHKVKMLQVESEKASLENIFLSGSYSICPNCGAKLLLSNMVFNVDVKEGDVCGHEKKVDS